jgi:hypothetical protein
MASKSLNDSWRPTIGTTLNFMLLSAVLKSNIARGSEGAAKIVNFGYRLSMILVKDGEAPEDVKDDESLYVLYPITIDLSGVFIIPEDVCTYS